MVKILFKLYIKNKKIKNLNAVFQHKNVKLNYFDFISHK